MKGCDILSDFIEIIKPALPLVSGAIGGAASVGLFKGPVKTLEDWWYITFGHTVAEKAALLRAEQEVNVEKLKQKSLEKISQIEPENIQQPKMNILGPALEGSKFYVDEEDLREMFSNLIAASMDSSKNNIVHPSFVEIVKQMTPVDASTLKAINSNHPSNDLICEYRISYSTGGFVVKNTNIYLANEEVTDLNLISASISNLERLGLITLKYGTYRKGQSAYDIFEHTHLFQDISLYIQEENRKFSAYKALQEIGKIDSTTNLPSLSGPTIEKGLIYITPFGKNFCEICLQ